MIEENDALRMETGKVDDIVLVETSHAVNAKLEICRDGFESKSFKLSGNKTIYMGCKFSKSRNKVEEVVKFDGQEISKSRYFQYLGSIINED